MCWKKIISTFGQVTCIIIIVVVVIITIIIVNRSNFPLFQITGWKFCETGLCDKINSYNRSLQECQKERANYSETDEICEVVIEIKIRFTQASANSIVECSDGKNGFAPQCAFGIHYAVAYSEIVSIHFF